MVKSQAAYRCSWLLVLLLACYIGACFFQGIAHADERSAADKLHEFLQQIEGNASKVKAFSCSFEQKKYLSIFNKPILFYGTLSIDRPDKMRWEITKPLPSILVLDGENGLQCNGNQPPRKFNTISDPLMKVVAKQLWSWLSGNYEALRENYTISMTDDNSGIVLEPLAKGIAQIISSVEVQFNPATLQPTIVTINEAGKDRTEIFFTNYILNISFSEDHFTKCSSSIGHVGYDK